jgi:hypothetical protein
MKQINLMSKFVLAALIATTVAFSTLTVPVVVAQQGPPQGVGGGPPIPDNSVTSESIQDGAVQTEDIEDGAVTSAKLAEGAGGGVPPTINEAVATVTILPGASRSVEANCPSGDLRTGGGYFHDPSENLDVFQNQPIGGENSWGAGAINRGSQNALLLAFAICLDTSP